MATLTNAPKRITKNIAATNIRSTAMPFIFLQQNDFAIINGEQTPAVTEAIQWQSGRAPASDSLTSYLFIYNGGRRYQNTSGVGNMGTTAPTHTTGTVNDGSLNLLFLSTVTTRFRISVSVLNVTTGTNPQPNLITGVGNVNFRPLMPLFTDTVKNCSTVNTTSLFIDVTSVTNSYTFRDQDWIWVSKKPVPVQELQFSSSLDKPVFVSLDGDRILYEVLPGSRSEVLNFEGENQSAAAIYAWAPIPPLFGSLNLKITRT